ncbi:MULTISPECIES: Maf family protein [Bacillaceae]|uniref:Maf family protein n=1 Tax=Bacillaceae TaxID=186817 RepID=UPI000BFD13E1|nr:MULTISPECIES: Maf family protein [Bacillaceae]PGT88171.1 septum formation inhibitor Maf [Bacillus sp. AFS040349]UGB29679.1 Maf family protein [Metabacillus sp. B2-18]
MKKNLILASASPRRKELLELLQLPFEVIASEVEEVVDEKLSPAEMVQSLAEQKAKSVAENVSNAFVIGSDTLVVYEGKMLGKPKDFSEAVQMLKMLSGKTHEVYTGVCLINNDDVRCFSEKTSVTIYSLTDKEIDEYVQTGEPMDKAGAYGIQGYGSLLVKEIHGDYYSVVGLPIARTKRELVAAGFTW